MSSMIRIRHPSGTLTFPIQPTTTLEDLLNFVSQQTSLDRNDIEIKTGYPPKTLFLQGLSPSSLLAEEPLKIRKGEQILVAKQAAGSSRSSPLPPVVASAASTSDISKPSAPSPILQTHAASKASSVPSFNQKPISNNGPPPRPSQPPIPASTARPLPLAASSSSNQSTSSKLSIPFEGQVLSVVKVPDDNSCLFSSINLLFTQSYSPESNAALRKRVVDHLLSQPLEYSEVMLGMSPKIYAEKMLKPSTWGGGIELAILAELYSTEIVALDVVSGLAHRFGQSQGYSQRGYIVYGGIHYDALALLPEDDVPIEFGATIFPLTSSLQEEEEDDLFRAARRLTIQLQKQKYATDTATFTLQCGICRTKLKGEKEATSHAMATGHTDFGEYEG